MPLEQQIRAAHADPTKAFFIDFLTRDIALSVCILDLIDNSVHSLIAGSTLDVSHHLIAGTKAPRINSQIAVSFGRSKFRITDTCGGVSVEDAEERVFLLGNPADETKRQAGLGVYGIGIKRAFFKIGKQISFQSHTTTEELRIDIDVDTWRNDPEWKFPFKYARPKRSQAGGTEIEICNLHPTVSDQFASNTFQITLLAKISRAYAL